MEMLQDLAKRWFKLSTVLSYDQGCLVRLLNVRQDPCSIWKSLLGRIEPEVREPSLTCHCGDPVLHFLACWFVGSDVNRDRGILIDSLLL